MNNTTNSINSQSLHVCDFYVKVEVDIVDVFTVAINMVLSVSAMLGNTLVLVAIRRTTALWLPTKILLSSLAFADLGVGLLAEPLFAMKILLEGRLVRCVVGVLFDVVSGHLSIASFLTMMAISIDKCMAAQLKLRYRIVVTEKRSIRVVTFIWVLAIPWAISFFVSLPTYCVSVLIVIPVCFLCSFIAFAKIRFVLQRQRTRTAYTKPSVQAEGQVHILRYKNSVRSMLYVYCAQVVAYFPAWLVMLIRVTTGDSTIAIRKATQLTLTFIFLNSTVNPVVYLWRIKELRSAACEVLPFIFKCLRPIRVENGAPTPSEDTMHHVRTTTFVEVLGPPESETGNRESPQWEVNST